MAVGRMPIGGIRRVAALGFGALFLLVSPAAFAAADPAKVLRIAFPTAETGFDPVRVSDLYSNTVNEAIFERLMTYDYLARPAKVVPMVAEAMPEVKDNGRVYVFRIRKGIHFTPDPAFKGQPRELTAEDFVYSYKRFLDPKNRSPWAFLLEGKIEGLDELAEAAKKSGKFDYDAKITGMRAVDRYTLEFRLKSTDYIFPYVVAHVPFGAVAREVIEAYSDDTQAHPVGTGPLRAEAVVARGEDRHGGQPGLPRLHLGLRRRRTGVGRRAGQGDARQEDAADRPRRDQHHRGRAVALAGVQPEGARHPQSAGGIPPGSVRRRQPDQGQVDGAGRGAVQGHRSGHRLHVLQLPRPAGRRLQQGKDRAAPGDHHGLQPAGRDSGRPQAPGGRGGDADTRRRGRPRPELSHASTPTTPRSRTSCSTISSTRAARTATARCPTASRS